MAIEVTEAYEQRSVSLLVQNRVKWRCWRTQCQSSWMCGGGRREGKERVGGRGGKKGWREGGEREDGMSGVKRHVHTHTHIGRQTDRQVDG